MLPYRQVIRDELPGPDDGLVVGDVDLTVRGFGPRYAGDRLGRIRLVEVKCATGQMSFGQRLTFAALDEMLRRGDPKGERYLGFWRVWSEDDSWQDDYFEVVRISDGFCHQFTRAQYLRWLNFGFPLR